MTKPKPTITIVARPIHPGDIEPGMRLRRRISSHGIQRTDELVCFQATDTHVINPQGYRIPYAGADWYHLTEEPANEPLRDLVAAIADAALTKPDKPVKLRKRTLGRVDWIEQRIGQGATVASVGAALMLDRDSIYRMLHRAGRDDLWRTLTGTPDT